MCFYDQMRWQCGDWKWANFRVHCQKEYRMGETCGLKMIYDTKPADGKCPLCLNIDKKQRRYAKAYSDYTRWREDPQRKASASKAYEDLMALDQEVKRLMADRQSRMTQVGNGRRSDARGSKGVMQVQ